MTVIFSGYFSIAQTGGGNAFNFLDLVTPARIAAQGGNTIAIRDNDLTLASQNPALLNESMDGQLALSGVNYFAGVKYGSAMYAKKFRRSRTWMASMNYVNYGIFKETEANGEETGGVFYASDYNLNIGFGVPMKYISVTGLPSRLDTLFYFGATGKIIYSFLDKYYSFGLAADLGLTYYNSKRNITSSLVVKNFGRQVRAYVPGNREPLPFEVQAGISEKLKLAPLRISLVLSHLEKWDLTYYDSLATQSTLTLAEAEKRPGVPEKIMRHVIIGTELLISKNFHIRFGYNYQKRKELGVSTRRSTTGLSWGFGFRISKFHLSYGRSLFHLAGPANHVTVSASLPEFRSGKKTYFIEQ